MMKWDGSRMNTNKYDVKSLILSLELTVKSYIFSNFIFHWLEYEGDKIQRKSRIRQVHDHEKNIANFCMKGHFIFLCWSLAFCYF